MRPLRCHSKCASAKKRSWFCLSFCLIIQKFHFVGNQLHAGAHLSYSSMDCTVCWFYWLLYNCHDREMSWDNFYNLTSLVWTLRVWAYAGMCSCSCSCWNGCSMFSPSFIVVVSLDSVPSSGCPPLCRTSEHEWNRLSYYAKLPDWFDLSESQHAAPPKYLIYYNHFNGFSSSKLSS